MLDRPSDDYHLVDWDAILTHGPVVAGALSMAGEFETFQGDAFTYLRVGHGADNEVLIANDSTGSINLAHVHFERLLAPILSVGGGADQTARDAAAAAQTTADTAEGTAKINATRVILAALPSPGPDPATWAETGNLDNIPNSKIASSIRGHRVYVQIVCTIVRGWLAMFG